MALLGQQFRGDFARRMIKSFLASLVLIAAAAPVGFAQKPPTGQPATPEEMYSYTFMSAITLCKALQQEIPFEKALPVGATAFYTIVSQKHAYKVPESKGKAITDQQLQGGVQLMTMAAAMEFCKDSIPKDAQDRLKKAAAAAKQGAPKP